MRRRAGPLLERYSTGYSTAFDGGATKQEGSHAVPKQPVGTALGSTKTSGAEGIHYLAPISVERLRQRRGEQEAERALVGAEWPEHRYEGEVVSMVFTTSHGGLANRQAVTKEIGRAAKAAGLDPTGLASHSGRRTVVTALYAHGGLDLADVA